MKLLQTVRAYVNLATNNLGPISIDLTALSKQTQGIKTALDPIMDGKSAEFPTLVKVTKALGREASSLAGLMHLLARHRRLDPERGEKIFRILVDASELHKACCGTIHEWNQSYVANGEYTASEKTIVAAYNKAVKLYNSITAAGVVI